jgi:hypothetical protein
MVKALSTNWAEMPANEEMGFARLGLKSSSELAGRLGTASIPR